MKTKKNDLSTSIHSHSHFYPFLRTLDNSIPIDLSKAKDSDKSIRLKNVKVFPLPLPPHSLEYERITLCRVRTRRTIVTYSLSKPNVISYLSVLSYFPLFLSDSTKPQTT